MSISLRSVLKVIAGFFILLVGIVLTLTIVGVKVDLSHLRGGVEISASTALGRDVYIDGPVEMEFSYWPALEVSDVRIANVPGATRPYFLNAKLARMKLGILPLLRGEINIADITAEEVTLNLESDAKGNPNWAFNRPQTPDSEKPPKTEIEDDGRLIAFTGLDHLSLDQIEVHYQDVALGKSISLVLESMDGTASVGESISLDFKGRVQDQTYDLQLLGDPLVNLMGKQKSWGFKLEGEVAGKDISGTGSRVLRQQEPEIQMELGVSDVDVGAILSALGLVEGMRASFGDIGIKATINGDSLNEVLQQSSMTFTVEDGGWLVTLPNTDSSIQIDKLSGDITVEKGNNITMKLQGQIDKEPIKLLITGAPLVEYITHQDEIPLTIDAEAAKSKLSFATKVKLPITDRDVTLALKVTSERIDHLNNLLRLDLPPLGPVSFESKLNVTNKGYDLSRLSMHVGDSQLEGKLKLDTSLKKPELVFSLVSKLIQLDDFDTGKRKVAKQKDAVDTADDKAVEKAVEESPTRKRRNLLSYEVLNAFDADITIEAQEVRSGKDRLGSALMEIDLKDAHLSVAPLKVNIPGGDVQAKMDFTPSPSDVTFNMQLNIEEFDVGVLARRAKPDTNMGGKLTLDVGLQSQAPDLASVMAHANGNFDFALVPQNFSSGIIDMWAVNILTAVMDKSTEKDQSTINCVIARLGMQDGIMQEKSIYLDTTKMFIEGKSDIDFKQRELELQLSPDGKRPEFFSLAIPIKVTGSFDDFELKIGLVRMAGKLVSFVTSPLHVPIQRIFTEDVPADGVSACKAAWTRTADVKASASQSGP